MTDSVASIIESLHACFDQEYLIIHHYTTDILIADSVASIIE